MYINKIIIKGKLLSSKVVGKSVFLTILTNNGNLYGERKTKIFLFKVFSSMLKEEINVGDYLTVEAKIGARPIIQDNGQKVRVQAINVTKVEKAKSLAEEIGFGATGTGTLNEMKNEVTAVGIFNGVSLSKNKRVHTVFVSVPENSRFTDFNMKNTYSDFKQGDVVFIRGYMDRPEQKKKNNEEVAKTAAAEDNEFTESVTLASEDTIKQKAERKKSKGSNEFFVITAIEKATFDISKALR